MDISVADAIDRLDRQGFVIRTKEQFLESMIAHIIHVIGRPLPSELEVLYQQRVKFIGDYDVKLPHRSGRMGFGYTDDRLGNLLPIEAIPIFGDGCGNIFALDLSSGHRGGAVYFFDHELGFEQPQWAAGSTLGRFLLLLSLSNPDIDNCPRARAIWNAG